MPPKDFFEGKKNLNCVNCVNCVIEVSCVRGELCKSIQRQVPLVTCSYSDHQETGDLLIQ